MEKKGSVRQQQPQADGLTERLRTDRVLAFGQVAVLVKIMLTVVILDPRSFDTFTLPKSVAAHVMSLALVALIIWLVARHGTGSVPWSPVHIGVGALLLAFALATPFALDQRIALFGTFKRYLGLTQMLDNVVLYAGIAIFFRDLRSLRLLALVGIGIAVPVVGYAAIQRLGLDPLAFVQGARVPISTLGNPDISGAFLSVIGVSAFGMAVLMPGPKFTWARVAAAVVGGGCLSILYATGTRAGVLAIGAGWLAVIYLALAMPSVSRARAGVILALAAVLGLAVVLSPIGARLDPSVLRNDLAIIMRVEIWDAANRAFLERPILGVGPDNFAAAYPSHRSELSLLVGEAQNSTHSFLWYVATSAGILGLVALVVLLGLLIGRASRLARAGDAGALAMVPLAAYLGQSLVTVNEIGIDWIFWAAAGVIAASGVPIVEQVRRHPARTRNARLVGFAALAAAGAIAVVAVLPRIGAGEAMLGSEAFAAAGRAREAIPYGQAAVDADPRRGDMWSSYGQALYRAQAYPAAVAALTVAAQTQPWQPLAWKNLAISWMAVGNRDAAHGAATRAVTADFYDGEAHDLLAGLAYDRAEYQRAVTEGRLALRYEVGAGPSPWFTTISAYVRLGDLESAEPLAREAVAQFPTNVQIRLQFAAILVDRGKIPEAIAVIDAVLKEQPDNVDARRLRDAISK